VAAVVDSHVHIFPNLGQASGFGSAAEHRRYQQLYMATHGEPVRRLTDHAPVREQTLHDGRLGDPSSLRSVNFRVGSFGRFEWTADDTDLYLQFFPPSLQAMESPPEFMLQQMARAGVNRAVLQNARPVIFTPGKIGVLLALAVAVWDSRRRRRPTLALVIGLAAGIWLVTVAVMTEAGFSGNPRYLIPAIGLLAVLAGAGWGWLAARAAWLAARVGRPGRAGVAIGLGVVVVIGVFAPFAYRRLQLLHRTEVALHYQAIVRERFVDTVAKLGGREPVLTCGQPFAGAFMVPLVSWYLKTPGITIGLRPQAPGVTLSVRTTRHAATLPLPPSDFRPVVEMRPWRVAAHCAPGVTLKAG